MSEERTPVTGNEITAAIESLLSSVWRDLSPVQINDGDCAEFARNVTTLLDYRVVEEWLPYRIPHCAIRFEDKWYDAETPHGAELKKLPFVIRFRAGLTAFTSTTNKKP